MYSPHIHTAEAFMALTQALFSPWPGEVLLKEELSRHDYRPPAYSPSPDAIQSVTDKLRDARLTDPDAPTVLVLINPNSSAIFPLRKWPALQFTSLCRRLLDTRPELRIAITGGRSERQEAETLAQQVGSPRCVNFAGQTTFSELLALYALASVMVTNDSGPAHFASLADLPTVVLFGPETPRLYRPLGDRVRPIYAGFACSPCVSVYNAKRSPCRNNRCLQTISVEQVYAETIALLDAPDGQPTPSSPSR
jgi:ADP-heptose:LPS heptosyltransferase